jgi:ABC-type dipeptide/oligopeptide/nickel transport system ATPase component
MSQKKIVFDFLESLPVGTTKDEAKTIFEHNYPDFHMPNFMFYRNQAEKEGLVEFPETSFISKSSTGISMLPVASNRELEYITIDLNNINPEQFIPLTTNTAFDLIASKRNGIMKGTVYMITGESGAGKTTVTTNIADYIKENNENATAGFISGEMDRLDWTEECLDNPRLAELETIFLLEYLDAPNYVEILTEALRKHDYVVLDSFEVILDQLKEIKGWTGKKAESELINILRQAAADTGNTIMVIQQYTKGGTFVGSNKIKHLLTGLIYVMFDENDDRYVVFTKNRRGGHMINKRLYFTKNKENGRLEFDRTRFENDQAIRQHQEEELNNIAEEEGLFDQEIMKRAKEMEERRKILLESGNRAEANARLAAAGLHRNETAA